MTNRLCSIITGTGSYIPPIAIPNDFFLGHRFYDPKGKEYPNSIEKTIQKFEEISGIRQRRYVGDNQNTSDIATIAAERALDSSGMDKNELDLIIMATNYGDVIKDSWQPDFVPNIANRVKDKLDISNPNCIPFDPIFGCPGWVYGLIIADSFIKSGKAKKVLVIGAETLSRVYDPNDRDCMLFADGAGAVVIEAQLNENPVGILTDVSRSDPSRRIDSTPSYHPRIKNHRKFLHMDGQSVYKYATKYSPKVVNESLDRAGLTLDQINMIVMHQANGRINNDILKGVYIKNSLKKKIEGVVKDIPDEVKQIMPMDIAWLGNSSVATCATMFDLIHKPEEEIFELFRDQLEDEILRPQIETFARHHIQSGDNIVFASVGAGMNISSVVYREV